MHLCLLEYIKLIQWLNITTILDPSNCYTFKKILKKETNHLSSSLFGRASTPGQTQMGLGPRVYPLLPQAAVLPGSDAGSDVVKPASSFIMQNRQTSCSMSCSMYGAGLLECGLWFVERCHTCNLVKE